LQPNNFILGHRFCNNHQSPFFSGHAIYQTIDTLKSFSSVGIVIVFAGDTYYDTGTFIGFAITEDFFI